MSMSHKAFAFDWDRFFAELLVPLTEALGANDPAGLHRFIEQNRSHLRDPYEGLPLPEDWSQRLETGSVHELGDYALTRYYDPQSDLGLGEIWLTLTESISADAQAALLGSPVGPAANPFDPGRLGSYFPHSSRGLRRGGTASAIPGASELPSAAPELRRHGAGHLRNILKQSQAGVSRFQTGKR
jgi:hypothetical protein